MPRKTKSETTTAKSAKTKTVKEKKTTSGTKKTAATKESKEKLKPQKTESTTTTPKHSQIILEYSRFGNLGLSTVNETVDISGLAQRKFTGRITTLFHFLRNTRVTGNLDTGKIATFLIDNKPILSLTQKADDFENKVFTLTKYKTDGTRQSTRKYSYVKIKNLILQAYGFDIKVDEDAEMGSEESENESVYADNMEDNTRLLPDNEGFGDDTDSEFDDID